jgi:hypothetical protein
VKTPCSASRARHAHRKVLAAFPVRATYPRDTSSARLRFALGVNFPLSPMSTGARGGNANKAPPRPSPIGIATGVVVPSPVWSPFTPVAIPALPFPDSAQGVSGKSIEQLIEYITSLRKQRDESESQEAKAMNLLKQKLKEANQKAAELGALQSEEKSIVNVPFPPGAKKE